MCVVTCVSGHANLKNVFDFGTCGLHLYTMFWIPSSDVDKFPVHALPVAMGNLPISSSQVIALFWQIGSRLPLYSTGQQ